MKPAAAATGLPALRPRDKHPHGYWQFPQFLLTGILLAICLTFRAGLTYYFAQDDFAFLARLAQVRTPLQWLDLFLRNDHFYRPVARVLLLGIPYALFRIS